MQIQVLEGQLTWLVHIVGAVIKGRLNSSAAESQVRPRGGFLALAAEFGAM